MDARSDDGQEANAGEVLGDVGIPENAEGGESQRGAEGEVEQDDLPKGVKERLGRQEKRHQKQMREMKAQMDTLLHHVTSNAATNSTMNEPDVNPYDPQPMQGANVEEQIHRAVSYALNHKDMLERKAEDAKRADHVNKQYGELHKHLDSVADKYDDFDDVVRGQDVPMTPHMRDAALMLPRAGAGSAGEVLYKLGKNRDELERIAKLHPIDQASEMVKLSHALMGGNEHKGSTSQSNIMGNIKSNPVTNSHGVTDKTSVGELRKRMKANWK